ncbi:MAG: DUF1937 family protein [Acidobacteriota bacterium]|jgi:hypothetical protein
MIWYLASPYTKCPLGQEAAFSVAARAAAKLMEAGLIVYSPIAHSHPVATHGNLDALDGAFWLRQNQPMMEKMDGLIVLKLPGWEESEGVQIEIDFFQYNKRPVLFASPKMVFSQADIVAEIAADQARTESERL